MIDPTHGDDLRRKGLLPPLPDLSYPVRLTKADARLLQKLLTMHVDYPELEPEHQALYDKLERAL